MNERSVAIHVTGLVQGVGYRAFVGATAARLGVTGWVVNRNDGSVDAALHGGGAALGELIASMRKGPGGARVDGLDLQSTDRGLIDQAPLGAHRF